jgi:hypothetical protein
MSLDIKKTKEFICLCYGIKPEELKGKCRDVNHFRPRQIISYILAKNTKMKLDDIALEIGLKDHVSIIHSVDKIENEIRQYPVFNDFVDTLIHAIKNNNFSTIIIPPKSPYYPVINFTKLKHLNASKKQETKQAEFKKYTPPPSLIKELNLYKNGIKNSKIKDIGYSSRWKEPNGNIFTCVYF